MSKSQGEGGAEYRQPQKTNFGRSRPMPKLV